MNNVIAEAQEISTVSQYTVAPWTNKLDVEPDKFYAINKRSFNSDNYEKKRVTTFIPVLDKEIEHDVLIINGEQVASLFMTGGIFDVNEYDWRPEKYWA